MQVAVTAAGGEVKKSTNGAHIGIAQDIEINENGLNHPLYKSKNKKFNSPAFNFDEVVTLPKEATHLASNKINKIQSIHFKSGISDVWGLQYHPEITYNKMINLIIFRKDRLIERGAFKDQNQIDDHIKNIEIDEIDIGSLVFEGVYTPEYAEPWATQQREAGVDLPKTLKNLSLIHI